MANLSVLGELVMVGDKICCVGAKVGYDRRLNSLLWLWYATSVFACQVGCGGGNWVMSHP